MSEVTQPGHCAVQLDRREHTSRTGSGRSVPDAAHAARAVDARTR